MAAQFRLLGDIDVRIGDRPVPVGHARQQAVLAVLLVEANHSVSTDHLIDRVWPHERLPNDPANALRTYISLLRRALAPCGATIRRQSSGYRLTVEPAAVDVHQYSHLITQARTATDDAAAALFERALQLWRGEPFAGQDGTWFRTMRSGLTEMHWTARLDLVEVNLRLGRHAVLVAELAGYAADRPLDERVAGQLMTALYRCGRQADALAEYQRIRRRLADELGTDPGHHLQNLHQALLTADPALNTSASVPTPNPPDAERPPAPASPPPAQLPADVSDFAGRIAELAQLDGIAGGTGTAVVISAVSGTAGVGKTALAVRWAHRVRDRFPDGQLYIDLRGYDPAGPMPPGDALARFLRALGVPGQAIPAEVDERAASFRTALDGRRMLLLLDNASSSDQVRALLPGTPSCVVIVTSRDSLPGLVSRHGARRLTLDALPAEDAVTLLGRLIGERVAADPAAAAELARQCAHLPLALRIAAHLFNDRPDVTLAEIVRELGDGYVLHLPESAVDLWRFRQLVADATEAQRQGRLDSAAAQLASALALWHGEPLAGVPALANHPKVVASAAERQSAVATYGDVMIAAGRAVDVIPLLEESTAALPWDEAGHARLIRAYRSAGRRGQAFAVYHEVRRRLVDELGVLPGAELSAAHVALLRDDESATQPACPAQLPPDVPDFVGRVAELSKLDRLVDAVQQPDGSAAVVVVVLSGTAGVGKTAAAVRWAHRVCDRYPDGQLYVNLRGYDTDKPVDVADALAHLLAALGVPSPDVPLGVDARAARYRTEMVRRRMLVVLDNAATAEQVRPLLPGTATSTVLVTSRSSLAGLVARDGAHRLELDLLPHADAHSLLRRLIGPRAASDPDAVTALANRCARLPLALRIAAELVLSRPTTALSELVDELADHQVRLALLDADGDPRATVTSVFSWSIRHLRPEVARAFRLFGLHPGPDLDGHAMAALTGTDLATARRSLDTLARAHLFHPVSSGRYDTHDLLRAYAAGLAADQDPDRHEALDRLLDFYLAAAAAAVDSLYPVDAPRRPTVAPPKTPVPDLTDLDTARQWLDAERANLVAIASYTASHGRPTHTVHLAATLTVYLDGTHYDDSLAVHRHALRAAQDCGSRSGEAQALYSIGFAHVRLGRYELATDHLRQAMAMFRQTGDRAEEARVLSVLGVVNGRTGRSSAAADHFRQALDAFRELGDGAGEANALSNLGIIFAGAGLYEAAADHFQQAVDVARRSGDVFRQANSIGNLGKIDSLLGRHETAADRIQQTLTVYRQIGDRGGEARALDNPGTVRTRMNRHREAAALFDQALSRFREIGDRAGETSVRNGLGELGIATDHPTDALTDHTAALAISTEIGHLDEQARAHAGLGHANRILGDPATARHHYDRALAIYTDLGSPEAHAVRNLLSAVQPTA